MASFLQGIIIKGIGGFYYVEAADTVYECRARGIFRKNGITPVAGDHATISVLPDGTGWVEEIAPRRNCLVRPPVANLDKLVVVISVSEPSPNLLVTDKMIAIAEKNDIEPVVIISKADLQDASHLEHIYQLTGLTVLTVSVESGQGVEALRRELKGKISAFTGNSGVGKSSLLNALDESLSQQTGDISRKLGRGRHTTRTVELFHLSFGGHIVDTPGFSSLDLERAQRIYKDELADCFREFAEYIPRCRFTDCTHTKESGCAVIEAVNEGRIARERHDSYNAIYEEVKDFKTWNQ